MKTFLLEIRLPDKLVYRGPARYLRLSAVDGGLEILPGHAPLGTVVDKAPIRYSPAGQEEVTMPATGGILLVSKEKTSLLLRGQS